MIDKDYLLKRVMKIEDKLLVSKILDKAERSADLRRRSYTDFIDPYQRSVLERVLGGIKEVCYAFDGGFPGAERVITIFSPNFMPINEDVFYELPLKLLSLTLNSRDELNHRDYLGSLMSLGIKREKIGDILVGENSAKIIVSDDMADYIAINLVKIKNAKVKVEISDIDSIEAPEVKVKEITSVIASLRLDCVAGAGFGMSRSKVAEYIKGEKLNLNWEATDNPAKQVSEGDTLSIRGKGRVILDRVERTTKSGRIAVVLKKYI